MAVSYQLHLCLFVCLFRSCKEEFSEIKFEKRCCSGLSCNNVSLVCQEQTDKLPGGLGCGCFYATLHASVSKQGGVCARQVYCLCGLRRRVLCQTRIRVVQWSFYRTYLNMFSFFAVINFIYVLPPNRTRSLLSSKIWVATYSQDLQLAVFQKTANTCPVIYYVILWFT